MDVSWAPHRGHQHICFGKHSLLTSTDVRLGDPIETHEHGLQSRNLPTRHVESQEIFNKYFAPIFTDFCYSLSLKPPRPIGRERSASCSQP